MARGLRKVLSAALCAALVLASPGPLAVSAFAANVVRTGTTAPGGAVVAPTAPAGVAGLSAPLSLEAPAAGLTLAPPLSLGAPLATAPEAALPTAAAALTAAPDAEQAALALSAQEASLERSARRQPAALPALQDGVAEIERAEPAALPGALDSLFLSIRRPSGEAALPAAETAVVPSGSSLSRGALAHSDEGGAAPPPAPVAAAENPEEGMNVRAVIGLFAQSAFSMAAFILTLIAYPLIASSVVGWTAYGTLVALGPLAAVAAGPLNGWIVDKLSARKAMALNAVLRTVLVLDMPIFAAFGILNFWTLALGSIANGWVMSFIMTTGGAFTRRLTGKKHLGTINGLMFMMYPILQVTMGLILGVGSLVDYWNVHVSPFTAFYIAAAVNFFLVLPISLWTMPDDSSLGSWFAAFGRGLRALPGALWRLPGRVLAGLRSGGWKDWVNPSVLAASIGLYFLFGSSLPITLALVFWIARTESFRAFFRGDYQERSPREREIETRIAQGAPPDEIAALRSEGSTLARRSFMAAGLLVMLALLFYPLQYFVMPQAAEALAGAAGKGLVLGQLMGALFFGNMISTAASAKLPALSLPLLGEVPGQRFVQAGVLVLAAAWVYTGLLPGSILAAAAAAGAAALLMALASRLSNRGWIQLFGLGFSAIWFPYLAWSGLLPVPPQVAMMLGLLAVGMFNGPAYVALNTYLQGGTLKEHQGKVSGVMGSFFNAAISVGIGLVALAAWLISPTYPGILAAIGAAYLLATLLFWRAPARLPGLPDTILKPKENK